MRYLQRITTYALLAVYGATALLGYGLHLLVPDAHHHGWAQVSCAEYAHPGQTGGRATPLASSEDRAACDGSCFVCDFLAQARNAQPHVTISIVWQHVAAEIVPFAPHFSAQTDLGPHAPRGPPTLAA